MPAVATTSCREFFQDALRESFVDLDLDDGDVAEYLADLLTRFTGIDEVLPVGDEGRMESLADCLRRIQGVWTLDGGDFDPEREVGLRRHVGDYTLFMSGFFWERVRGASMTRHYRREGRRAYRFVAEHDRALGRADARIYRTLADHFQTYANTLTYMREIYLGADFAPWPHPLFVRILGDR